MATELALRDRRQLVTRSLCAEPTQLVEHPLDDLAPIIAEVSGGSRIFRGVMQGRCRRETGGARSSVWGTIPIRERIDAYSGFTDTCPSNEPHGCSCNRATDQLDQRELSCAEWPDQPRVSVPGFSLVKGPSCISWRRRRQRQPVRRLATGAGGRLLRHQRVAGR